LLGQQWLHHATKIAEIKKVIVAHGHIVNVLASNITFLIFADVVVWCSNCCPYKPF